MLLLTHGLGLFDICHFLIHPPPKGRGAQQVHSSTFVAQVDATSRSKPTESHQTLTKQQLKFEKVNKYSPLGPRQAAVRKVNAILWKPNLK